MKTCNKCNAQKLLTEFGNDKRNSDGLQGICNACKNKNKQERRDARVAKADYVVHNEKCCNKCSKTKPISAFFADKAMRDGKSSICKDCKRENVYKWREANKDKYNADMRAYQKANPEMRYGVEIKRRYGCTLEEYNKKLIEQEGKCDICGCLHNPADKKGRLYVDHCHKSRRVRALLCKHCNSMLGYAKDDVDTLSLAIEYLKKHSKEQK